MRKLNGLGVEMDPEAQLPITVAAILAAPFVGRFLATHVVGFRSAGGRTRRLAVCPGCGAMMALRDRVPLISWCLSRGRCRHCGAPIGTFYPLVELAAVGVALWAATVFTGWQLWATCLLGWTLIGLAVIDYRHFLLPDVLTLPLLAAGLIVAGLSGEASLGDAVIGAGAGFAVFATVGWLYRCVRGRDGLGLGDAKLLGAAGAWVGWSGLPSVVLVASLTALAAARGRVGGTLRLDSATPVAFGPFLGFATWLGVLYGPLLG